VNTNQPHQDCDGNALRQDDLVVITEGEFAGLLGMVRMFLDKAASVQIEPNSKVTFVIPTSELRRNSLQDLAIFKRQRVHAAQDEGYAPDVTPLQMIVSRRSEACPMCPDRKISGHAVCRRCFGKLPPRIRGELFKCFGQGYEGGFAAMMAFFRKFELRMPEK
jgi:hypothetical protein